MHGMLEQARTVKGRPTSVTLRHAGIKRTFLGDTWQPPGLVARESSEG